MAGRRQGTGLTGFASLPPVVPDPPSASDLEVLVRIRDLLAGSRFALLTGAGLSTDSGIPDYRGPDSPPRSPMTYQEFVREAGNRQRYWARNHIGWSHLRHADPNQGHYSAAELERRGYLTGLITQNVDRLHQDAGSSNVVDLHGRYDQVVCLDCHAGFTRAFVQQQLQDANPAMAGVAARPLPDGDAQLEPEALAEFHIPWCVHCGGMLKPDVVFFGDGVPAARTADALASMEAADALLVIGSSLVVYSGYRFCRMAAAAGKPIAALNLGKTRADALLSLKVAQSAEQVLPALLRA